MSYTIITDTGQDALKAAKSMYIVFNNPERERELLWVDTKALRQCFAKYPCKLIDSKYNKSKYIWIKDYVDEHKEFFGNSVRLVTIEL